MIVSCIVREMTMTFVLNIMLSVFDLIDRVENLEFHLFFGCRFACLIRFLLNGKSARASNCVGTTKNRIWFWFVSNMQSK